MPSHRIRLARTPLLCTISSQSLCRRDTAIFRCHTILPLLRQDRPFTSRPSLLSSSRPQSEPRKFPTSNFYLVPENETVEEERLVNYRADIYYPVHLGEVFQNRYQVVTKLGYGASSTIWLARDLQQHRYVALKIYIHNSLQHRELPFYQHLKGLPPTKHEGASKLRMLDESFEVVGPHGKHIVLVLLVSQMSLCDIDMVFMDGKGFEEDFVKAAIVELLVAVDFLHTEAQVVHTDIHNANLLLGADDDSIFREMEETELKEPSPRKELPDRTIYCSRVMTPSVGPFLLSDFGEARIGPGPYGEDAMPTEYRAPEVLLRIKWSYPVDIWSVGLTAWSLLQSKNLFRARKRNGNKPSDAAHLADLVAVLGSPPPELLEHHPERAHEFWDRDGKWRESVPIPTERTLEARETKLDDKNLFLNFMRRALTWDPNKRPTAKELLQDPWLMDVEQSD